MQHGLRDATDWISRYIKTYLYDIIMPLRGICTMFFFFFLQNSIFFLQNIFVKTKHLKLSDWFLGSFFFKGTMYVSYYARGKVAPGIDTLNLLIQDIHIDITHAIFYCCMVCQTSNTKVENKQKMSYLHGINGEGPSVNGT